ncbi:CHASE3 domain-containing protein [Streptomyces sp. NPDC001568]|uniref:CHASE3 domain-containing protein n=1 Tax=Streptomyces sp. NPDC001568 TaxID=3364588 RepID=UPI0036AF443E
MAIRLETALLNQETGIRGFGATGSADFPAPYRQGLRDEKASADGLARLLTGDEVGLRDLRAVEGAAAKWQERIAGPVAAAAPGAPSSLGAERAEEGRRAGAVGAARRWAPTPRPGGGVSRRACLHGGGPGCG